jgi:cell division protein FtsQ
MISSHKFFLSILLLFAIAIAYSVIADKSLLKIDQITIEAQDPDVVSPEFNKIKPVLEARLKEWQGQFLWDVKIEQVLKTILADVRISEAHVMRKLPNQIYIAVKARKSVLVVMNSQGDIFPIAEDASLMPAVKASEAPDVPVLRGKKFLQTNELRKLAVQMIQEIPETGVFSRQAISEISYDKEGFWLSLINRGVRVKMGEGRISEKSDRVARVLRYLESEDLNGRVIDASLSKKVLVKLRNHP